MTDFNFSGFEVTPGDWERFVNDSLSWLGQFDMVCVSGSLPSGVSPEAFTDWMTRLRSQCPCIIFDSSREALVAGLKAEMCIRDSIGETHFIQCRSTAGAG